MSISLISLVIILVVIDPAKIWAAIVLVRYEYLLLSLLGVLAFMVLRAIRWSFMLNFDVAIVQVLHIQNIGYMLTNLLPFRIGDVARAVLIGSVPPVTISRGISTMIVERVLDMLFIVTLLPFTLIGVETLPDWMRSAALLTGGLAVTAILILVLAANQRPLAARVLTAALDKVPFLSNEVWVQRMDDMLLGLEKLTRFRDGFVLLVLSIVTWLPIVFTYYYALLAANIQPSWTMAGFVVCAAGFSVAAPSSPGGVGVFHAGVIAALLVLGQPEAEAAGFAFVYHTMNLMTMVILGMIGLTQTGSTFGNVVASARQFASRGSA